MKSFPYIFLLALIVNISCKNNKTGKESTDNYKTSKLTIQEVERKNPVRFLIVSETDKHNIIGQTVIKGDISSMATLISYKDVAIRISFLSKTGTLLEEDEEMIYEVLKPGTHVDFKSKYFAPKGTAQINMKITAAKALD